MSYRTLEVDLDNDRVVPRGNEPLPEHGTALLTILRADVESPSSGKGASLAERVAELKLDRSRVAASIRTDRDAR